MLIKHDYIEVRETNVMPNDPTRSMVSDLILIKRNLSETRKAEVLYEELTHHKLTYGNILDQSKFNNRNLKTTLGVTGMKMPYLCALLWRRITMVLVTYMN